MEESFDRFDCRSHVVSRLVAGYFQPDPDFFYDSMPFPLELRCKKKKRKHAIDRQTDPPTDQRTDGQTLI